jgi:hypothetical protein
MRKPENMKKVWWALPYGLLPSSGEIGAHTLFFKITILKKRLLKKKRMRFFRLCKNP